MERWIFYRKSRSTLNMLHPLFIRPQFFIDLIDNDELFIQTKNFIIKFDDIWEEIFILVDDDNESLKKEYENIIKKYSQEFPPIKTIIEKFLSLLQYKNVKIKTNKKGFNVNNILQSLKENDVRHVVEFPNYFENPFINLKKIGAERCMYGSDRPWVSFKSAKDETLSFMRKHKFNNEAIEQIMYKTAAGIFEYD